MAQNWVSFEEVKSRVSMKDVLAHYGLMEGTAEKPSKQGIELRLCGSAHMTQDIFGRKFFPPFGK